jgi:hypothetical protein
MARPAFLSGLGSKDRSTPTGLLPPSQRDKQTPAPRIDTTDVSGFSTMGQQDRSKPPQLTPPVGIKRPDRFDINTFMNEFEAQNTGVMPMVGAETNTLATGTNPFQVRNIAQQVLGDSYNKAMGLGYQPSELIDMVNTAQSFGRGIDVNKFSEDLDRFSAFQQGGPGTQIDGTTFLNVQRPTLSANPPEGVMGLIGALGGPFVDMLGDVAEAGAEGRVGAMNLLRNLSDKVKSMPSIGELTNPGNIRARLDAAGPEAKRIYALKLSQGLPFQQAFEEATGEKFATGGIATLQ